MKLLNYLLITAPLACSLCFAAPTTTAQGNADDVNRVLNVRDGAEYTYPTKFGDLKFVRADGTPGEPAENITLNGEPLLSTKGQIDKQGELLFLMSESQTTSSREKLPRRAGQAGKTETTRMVVLVGQGTCTKKLVVMDFTGAKPFVSEKFGNDPQERACLIFKKAKWGKKESEITLRSGATYLYDAAGKVSGPFAFE